MEQDPRRAKADFLIEFFGRAPMKQTFGMTLRYLDDYRAEFTQPYHPGFDHTLGGIHGGVFATLLDNAGWFTAAMQYDTWVSTLELHVRLLEPVKGSALVATARLLRVGKSFAVAEMEVRAGDRLAAVGSGTFTASSIPLVSPHG